MPAEPDEDRGREVWAEIAERRARRREMPRDAGSVTIELGVREARALANVANVWGDVLHQAIPDDLREGLASGPAPLVSAAMKLEVALVSAGHQL